MGVFGAVSAFATQAWIKPTAAELSMKTDPQAPGASAVILERRETVDEAKHYHSVYERIKVLTAAGTRYGTVTIPWEQGAEGLPAVEARTVEPDGKVVPYTGTPERKYVTEPRGQKQATQVSVQMGKYVGGSIPTYPLTGRKEAETVFRLPAVRVGSIVEYRWSMHLKADWAQPPEWTLQQPLFMHKAEYRFVPFKMGAHGNIAYEATQESPGAVVGSTVSWLPNLPPGVQVGVQDKAMGIEEQDVPALTREAFAPPGSRRKYWIDFFYPEGAPQKFWEMSGATWSGWVERFAKGSGGLKKVVAKVTAGSTTPMEKLQKIYAATMGVENLNYQPITLEPANSGKASRGKRPIQFAQYAMDVWRRGYAAKWDIAELFLAMAREAGFQAAAMRVGDREQIPMNTVVPDWNQLPGEIVVVTVNGKRMFFDPEEPYCPFGELAWDHQGVMGLLQVGKGAVPTMTPMGNYKQNEVLRNADLTVAANGGVTGTIRVTMTGAEAMRWRQEALQYGEKMTAGDFDAALEKTLPAGVTAKTERFGALTDGTEPLVAFVTVGGTVGELKAGGKLPSEFLLAREKQVFQAEARTAPVDLKWPYIDRDQVKVTLPAGYSVTGLPQSGEIPYPGHADAVAQYSVKGNVYEAMRLVALGQTVYSAGEYGPLRVFYRAMQERDVATVKVTKG